MCHLRRLSVMFLHDFYEGDCWNYLLLFVWFIVDMTAIRFNFVIVSWSVLTFTLSWFSLLTRPFAQKVAIISCPFADLSFVPQVMVWRKSACPFGNCEQLRKLKVTLKAPGSWVFISRRKLFCKKNFRMSDLLLNASVVSPNFTYQSIRTVQGYVSPLFAVIRFQGSIK